MKYAGDVTRRASVACAVALTLAASTARAQQPTFQLDRLQIPGAPDDGIVLFRPVTQPSPMFFGQLSLGYSRAPLLTSDITNDTQSIRSSPRAAIQDQFTQYMTAGFEFLDRFIVSVTLPVTWVQDGNLPNYTPGIFGGVQSTTFRTTGPGTEDTRLDLRGVILTSRDRKFALGGQFSAFFPSGTASNFGGDGSTGAMFMVTAEYTIKFVTIVANTGIDLRPQNSINAPGNGIGDGLGIGDEWRWALGAFIPIRDGKFRIGASIFGQTGIQDTNATGPTFFVKQNTPLEWNAEGRMKLGPHERFWVGAGFGSRLDNGYGAPDFRLMALAGVYVPILDSEALSPAEQRLARHEKWKKEAGGDRDHDGIPDDVDACPDDPEDHLGSEPNDGCPLPPDRDGDGIPDSLDKCPDVPEDKDGIQDADGCPEDDADHDGIPDTQDACPREPGKPSPDPKKNGCPQYIKLEGSTVRVLQQVHFAYNSATILPDSFSMLDEIAALLKASPQIKKMSIEGHTDDRGPDEYNLTLSQNRANSVRTYLVQHGIDGGRLTAHGYGKLRPIADNGTDEGRQANRRVEFKIIEEGDASKPSPPAPPAPPTAKP
jgi:OmpA-OmpF porin, OOP family